MSHTSSARLYQYYDYEVLGVPSTLYLELGVQYDFNSVAQIYVCTGRPKRNIVRHDMHCAHVDLVNRHNILWKISSAAAFAVP